MISLSCFSGINVKEAREFQRVYIFAHRLQDILQVTFAHWSIVGATDLGDTARAGIALALVHTNEWKCSFAHRIDSLSRFKKFKKLSGIAEKPARGDKLAMCAINRHLQMAGLIFENALTDILIC